MKLLKLTLENFQGIKKAEFDFSGSSATLYGDNATGKTTVFNAFTWLLFDKASTGAKSFTPKTKDETGDAHYLEHSSEATFEVNGHNVILKKIFKENYKKKRGSTSEEFDGHVVNYFINGVPRKEKEYTEAVVELCGDAEKMKILTMPDYFPEEMSWDGRRRVLLDACGDITDTDVINSTEELRELPEYLKMPGNGVHVYSVDDYRKIAQAARSDIKKRMEEIPLRINEAERAMPDICGYNADDIERVIHELTTERDALELEKRNILSGANAESDLRKRIADKGAELAEAKAAHIESSCAANSEINMRINELKNRLADERGALFDAETQESRVRKQLNQVLVLRAELMDEYKKVRDECWCNDLENCPACGQQLPGEDIEKSRERFNLNKSQRLEAINARGKNEAAKEKIQEMERHIEDLKEKRKNHVDAQARYTADLERLQGQIISTIPFEHTEAFLNISEELKRLREEDSNIWGRTTAESSELSAKISSIQIKINVESEKRAAIRTATAQRERIRELAEREKELATEFEKLEKGLYLCELFVKTKVNLLTEKINSKFKSVRFRLFVEQINGGVKEDCEVMIPSEDGRMVPYGFANNAARINAGLEIIDTLSEHWGVEIPVFVDNAESVTKLTNINTQVIRLVVSEQDKTLRLGIDKESKNNRQKEAA